MNKRTTGLLAASAVTATAAMFAAPSLAAAQDPAPSEICATSSEEKASKDKTGSEKESEPTVVSTILDNAVEKACSLASSTTTESETTTKDSDEPTSTTTESSKPSETTSEETTTSDSETSEPSETTTDEPCETETTTPSEDDGILPEPTETSESEPSDEPCEEPSETTTESSESSSKETTTPKPSSSTTNPGGGTPGGGGDDAAGGLDSVADSGSKAWPDGSAPAEAGSVTSGLETLAAAGAKPEVGSAPNAAGPAPDLSRSDLKHLRSPGIKLEDQDSQQLIARNAGNAHALPSSTDRTNPASQPVVIATMALAIAAAALVRSWLTRQTS